jgi:MED7 protein
MKAAITYKRVLLLHSCVTLNRSSVLVESELFSVHTIVHIFVHADIASHLSVLNRALLHALVELLDALEKTPTESARELETVLAVQNNMMHLCNRLRMTQGTSTLRYILTQDIEEKEALLNSLQQCAAGVEAGIVDAAKTIASS